MAEYIDPMKPLIEQFMSDFRIQQEENIMRAVADVGICVDKPRLLQALTDAKAFYEEGYKAAMTNADLIGVVRCKDCAFRKTPKCGFWFDDAENKIQERWDYPDGFCSYGERKDEDNNG